MSFRYWFWLLACSIFVCGCGRSEPPTSARAKQMVYVDTATNQPLVHDSADSFPATHPVTGKPTLLPALFCATCQKWYPAPSLEDVNRTPGAGLCPKDKTPLIADGPWPDGSNSGQGAIK